MARKKTTNGTAQKRSKTETKRIRVLFVCLGNICRSPTAHGVFQRIIEERGLSERVIVDSAGTGGWHVGEPPDPRMRQAAQLHGIDLGHLRARRVMPQDFEDFDYILAMDCQNLADLESMCPPRLNNKLYRFTAFAPQLKIDSVPDPYYGPGDGFTEVFRICEAGAAGLLETIIREHKLADG